MLITDLSKLGEPIKKLIEVIGDAASVLYEPTKIKRESQANAEAIKIISKAKVDALILADQSIRDYYLKIETRELHKQFQRQNNRDNIVVLTANDLLLKTVEQNPVDPDWINEFFNIAENVSNTEMQLIWAKILSNEVQKPGTFSKRTLNTLRLMSSTEAKAFELIAKY